MNIGIAMFPTGQFVDVALLAKWTEELGFESLWAPEHTIIPVNPTAQSQDYPNGTVPVAPREYSYIADPFVSLARASSVTTKLRLGTSVCLLPEHNPLILAKQIATLDMYSSGRFLFGVGAGWLKEETEIMGGDFNHRWTQAKEAVLAMKQLWTENEGEYHGKYFDFPPVYCFPKPMQHPHPPVLLGGRAANVFKRVVAWGDGWIPNEISPSDVSDGRETLDKLAERVGRDPASIDVSIGHVSPDSSLISQYEDAGADRVIIRLDGITEEDSMAKLDRIASLVLS